MNAMVAYEARDESYFAGTLRDLSQRDADLQLLAVHEEGVVYYFFARRTDLFLRPPPPTADMTSVPAYRAPALTSLRLLSVFEPGGLGHRITVETLYDVLTVADLHRVGKEVLYVLFVFLVVTATVLLVMAARASRPSPRPAAFPAPPSRPPDAPQIAVQPPPPVADPVADAEPAPLIEPPAPQASEGPRPVSLYREDTGLVYRDFLESRLRSELDRAAASDQDMALAVLAIDRWQALGRAEAVAAVLAGRLRESFPFRDLVFEYGHGFALIIPDISLDKALQRLEDFRAAVEARPVGRQNVTVSAGVGARNGRLITEETLLREASQALAKAIRDGENQVVAFRADPDKFRRMLAT
jgi:diguanylate cyclase (GGDEF)-like protein